MKSINHIACAFDDSYISHAAAMLYSLVAHNDAKTLHIHVLYAQIKKENIDKLTVFLTRFGCQITFHKIGKSLIKEEFKISHHVSVETYFRILIPELLPDVDRVLYLDCDLIVMKSLNYLFNIDLNEQVLAATPEAEKHDMKRKKDLLERLRIPLTAIYFNSGVLLIDCIRWREERITNRLMAFIIDNSEKLSLWDQDALNAILYDRWMRLSATYNQQTAIFAYPNSFFPYPEEECKEAKVHPTIVHFSTSTKPWRFSSNHPYASVYWKNLKLTPWKRSKMESANLKSFIVKLIPLSMQYTIANLLNPFK